MTTNRNINPIKYLAACLVIVAVLCVAQVRGSSIVTLSALVLQLILVLMAAFKGFASPILLFFLPWSTLMKLAPGSISFYSLSLIGTCCAYVVRFRGQVNMRCVVAAIFLLGLTLPAKILAGGSISMDYMLFFFLLALFPMVMRECAFVVSHRILTLFFSLGIICAALSARALAGYGNIARYIHVDSWTNVVRYCGYYGDANFYSAQICAVLGGVLVQILGEKDWKNILLWIGLTIVLIYCGLMSASKTFVITLGLMMLLWLAAVLVMPGKIGSKLVILLGTGAGIGFVIGSDVFTQVIEVIVYRFSFSSNTSDLTTGRIDLWINYAKEIMGSLRILLIGNGYTNLKVNAGATHNTVIQMIFQFGLIGSVMLIQWLSAYVRDIRKGFRPKVLYSMIILVGTFLPWMALDLLFFDEFFLMPLYAVSGMVAQSEKEKLLLENEIVGKDLRHHMDNLKFRQITLKKLWNLFVQRLVIIVLVAAVVTGATMAGLKMSYIPRYSSTATLYILRQSQGNSTSDTVNDFSLALKVVNDCAYMLKSHAVLDEVISQLELNMNYDDLYDCISITNPEDTRILEVTVNMNSAQEAKRIVDALCKTGSRFIAQAMGFEQVNLLEYGTLQTQPSNKVGMMTYALTGIAAAVVTYCAFLLRLILNERIHSGDDL